MKLLSTTYIIFLAFKLWKTSTIDAEMYQPSITAKALFCATLLNPKALFFASAIFPASRWSSFYNYLIHMGTFFSLIIPIATFWIFISSFLVSNRIS